MSDIVQSIDGLTLAEVESLIEHHVVTGARSFVEAWQLIDRIHETEMWKMKMMSDGRYAVTFEVYLDDFIGSMRDKYPTLPISRASVGRRLTWMKRGRAMGISDDAVVAAPVSALNRVSQLASFDKDTGEVTSVKTDIVNVDALPGLPEEDVRERFKAFVSDVVNATSVQDAHKRIDEIRRDYEDEFDYIVVRYNNRLTVHKVRWTRRINGAVSGVKTYDLHRDELPDEVVADYCGRLGTYPNDGELLQEV